MQAAYTRDEVLSVLDSVDCATVSTASGTDIRSRMMHYWNDRHFNIYVATLKRDPKTLEITENPSISLLALKREESINDFQEVEVTGRAIFVRDEAEKNAAFEALAQKSPVVKYLRETNNLDLLDCLKVVPLRVKYRVFREIVKGAPPTVLDFPENRAAAGEFQQLRRKLRHWRIELRAPFLTATAVSVILGAAVAWARYRLFDPLLFTLSFAAAMLLHLGTNMANDYFDHKSGNDEVNRSFVRPFSGGSRTIQLGLLTPLEVLSGALLCYTLGVAIGLYLAWTRGWVVLLLGVIGLVSGFFYTSPPLNWASLGVGEALVGLNFGALMTLGAYYVQAQTLAAEPLLASIPVSLLIAAVLYLNEFPDYEADETVGKSTLVVRLGRGRAAYGYAALMLATYSFIAVGVLAGLLPLFTVIGLATLPLAVKAIRQTLLHHSSSFDLAPANALTALSHLLTSLLISLGYAIEALGATNTGIIVLLALGCVLYSVHFFRQIEKQRIAFIGLKKIM